MAFVLAIDQGTTNSKALLVDERGTIAARASRPVGVTYPRPGWVEQSPAEIWTSVVEVARRCIDSADGAPVAAIAISNQRESVLIWNRRTGKPIGPCVTWQCRRSAERIDRLRTAAFETMVRETTGLGLDPLFPAAKIGWMLDADPEARRLASRGELCAGTVDAWLVFNLTAGKVHATDFGNASRTQLFAIAEGAWSATLQEAFGLPAGILPTPLPSDGDFGATDPACGLPAGIPIRAVMGDSHAALFGHGIRAPGQVKATFGTGSSLMTLTDGPVASRNGLSTTIAWRLGEQTAFALEGNITVSAQAAAWTARLLGLPSVDALTTLAQEVLTTEGVVFVPALAGLGAPHWQEQARATFSGMSLGTGPAHLARATFEAIALQIADVFDAMETDLGRRLDALSVDGAATINTYLMQIQADLLGRRVQRARIAELSAIGAAAMAGLAVGFWNEARLATLLDDVDADYAPALADDHRRAKRTEWRNALSQVLQRRQ